jgi:N4-gp56 family major capsid protein
MSYNAPPGTQSGIENDARVTSGAATGQLTTYEIARQAIYDNKHLMVFSQLSSTIEMPKHKGKTIKVRQYYPLLDARNVNDEGIDAAGTAKAPGTTSLIGSSKDIGFIKQNLPELDEQGGRKNRVGFTRTDIEGRIYQYGFFFEYTNESLQFDSDSELLIHIAREATNAAMELEEHLIQLDLLDGAGVIAYSGGVNPAGGAASSIDTMNGNLGQTADVVTYAKILEINKILDRNRLSKNTTIITGTRLVDTKTVQSARYAYIGHDLENTIRGIQDRFSRPAFIGVEQYAAGTTVANGEIGAVGPLRFIVVHQMLAHENAGAVVGSGGTANAGYKQGSSRYNVYPILIVGGDSFVTIGFQDNGKSSKFIHIHKKPGMETADAQNPYGLKGFHSIRWWHGTVIKRPEWIAKLYTLAEQ